MICMAHGFLLSNKINVGGKQLIDSQCVFFVLLKIDRRKNRWELNSVELWIDLLQFNKIPTLISIQRKKNDISEQDYKKKYRKTMSKINCLSLCE